MKTASIRQLTTIGVALVCLLTIDGKALAQTFRCSDASGQSQYQQWPCAQSQAQRVVQVADARTSAQRTQAADMAEREQKLLREMSRDHSANPTRALSLTIAKRKAQAEPAQPPTADLKRIPHKRDFRAVHKAERRAHQLTRKRQTQARSLPSVAGR